MFLHIGKEIINMNHIGSILKQGDFGIRIFLQTIRPVDIKFQDESVRDLAFSNLTEVLRGKKKDNLIFLDDLYKPIDTQTTQSSTETSTDTTSTEGAQQAVFLGDKD